jgi:hypothetical protein
MNTGQAVVTGALLLAILTGCGTGDSAAASIRKDDNYQITEMVTNWHQALTTKDVELALSLFAHGAVLTAAGKVHSGKDEIRKFLNTQTPFRPESQWISLTHTPSIRHTVSGSRGTLYFECHFFDVDSRRLVNSTSGDARVVRVHNQWLFTSVAVGNAIVG